MPVKDVIHFTHAIIFINVAVPRCVPLAEMTLSYLLTALPWESTSISLHLFDLWPLLCPSQTANCCGLRDRSPLTAPSPLPSRRCPGEEGGWVSLTQSSHLVAKSIPMLPPTHTHAHTHTHTHTQRHIHAPTLLARQAGGLCLSGLS